MVQETQDLITAMTTDGRDAKVAVEAALRGLVGPFGDEAQTVERISQLLAGADLAETDESVRALFEEGQQKINALRREREKMMDAGRKVLAAHRALGKWLARVQDASAG